MASAIFTVNNDAGTSIAFTLQGTSGRTAEYINTQSSLSEPLSAVMGHDIKSIGSKGTDRHNVSFKQTVLDVTGAAHTCSISVQIAVPRSAVITSEMIYDLRAFIVGYLTKGHVGLLIDGITP